MPPKPIAVIDCETDPFERGIFPEPFIFGFYDGHTYEQFDDVEKLVEYLSDKEIIVYAHNGGKFDYFFMLDYLEPYADVMIISGRVAKFKIGACEFRDSYNILPVPLAAWQKDDFDYRILKKELRDLPHNRKKIEAYLYSDCFNLYSMVTAFIDRFGMHLTQASCSMKTWSGMTGLTAPRSSPEYYEQFSQYYYGGRVECFETGIIETDFKVADINSAYPFAMLSKHPFGLEYELFLGDLKKLLKEFTRDEIGPSFFTVRARSRGAFPYRGLDNSLYFPADDVVREYNVTGWELLAGIDTGTVRDIEILHGFIFLELIDFAEYILHFYKERKLAKETGDKATDLFSKLLMNSLYGKFGSNADNYGKYLIVPHELIQVLKAPDFDFFALPEDEQEQLYELTQYDLSGDLGPWAVMRRDLYNAEKRFYNVATSASITGYVRAYLWRNICKCQGVLYCDTDSIAAEDIGDIKISNDLGDWGIDGVFDKAAISGKKMYAFHHKPGTEPTDKKTGKVTKWKCASKGVKLSARKLLHVAKGGEVLFVPENPTYSVHKGPHFTPRKVKITAKSMPE